MDRRGHSYRAILLLAVLTGGRAAVAADAQDEFTVAAGHYQAGRWDLAAEAFESFERLYPGHSLAGEARLYRGESLAQAGRFQEAARVLDELIESDLFQAGRGRDKLRRAMFRRAESAYLARDFQTAADHLEVFRDAYPEDELFGYVSAYLGDAHAVMGNHAPAIDAFRAALASGAVDEAAARCHAGLAVSLAATGRIDRARTHLAALKDLSGHAEVPSTLYRVAKIAYAAGSRDTAAELFEEAAAMAPASELAAQALTGLAWARLRQDDLAGSAEAFEELMQKFPGDPRAAEAAFLRGQILQRCGDYDAALATYRRAIEHPAGDRILPRAIYSAARLHDRLQQSHEARLLYERLINEHPRDEHGPSALYHLGWLLRDLGELQAAIDAWQAVHQRAPDTPQWREATYLLAEHALEAGDTSRAQDLVDQLLETFAGHGAPPEPAGSGIANDHLPERGGGDVYSCSLLLAAQLAMARDEWEAARDLCQRLATDGSSDSLRLQAQFWVAEAEFRLHDFSAAYEQLERLASATAGREGGDAWLPLVPLRMAQVLAHQQRWPEAKQAALRVIEQHADFRLRYEADYVLGRCLAAAGEFDAARQAYQRVIDSEAGGKSETAAMAQWMIGETHMHQKDYDAALRAYLRGEILFPYPQWQAHSLLQAGKCYELLGDSREAHATYRRLLDRFPGSDLNDQARDRLDVVARQRTTNTN